MKRYIFTGLLVVLILAVATVFYIYNKPHRDVVDEKAEFSLSVDQMHDEFSSDETAANQKYFNQVVELNGTLTSLKDRGDGHFDFVISSDNKVANGEIVEISQDQKDLLNKKVKVKGLFIGYDNLLEEIQLSECTLKK